MSIIVDSFFFIVFPTKIPSPLLSWLLLDDRYSNICYRNAIPDTFFQKLPKRLLYLILTDFLQFCKKTAPTRHNLHKIIFPPWKCKLHKIFTEIYKNSIKQTCLFCFSGKHRTSRISSRRRKLKYEIIQLLHSKRLYQPIILYGFGYGFESNNFFTYILY